MKKLMLSIALLLSGHAMAKVELSGFVTPSLKMGSDSTSESYETKLEMIDAGITIEGEVRPGLSGTIALVSEQENLDDASSFSLIDEAYLTQSWEFGTALKAGRSYLNFGNYETAFISDPSTLLFGEIQTNLLELSYSKNGFNTALYFYNSDESHVKEGDKGGLSSYGATASYQTENATLGLSYISNMAGSSLVDLDSSKKMKKVIGAYSAFAHLKLNSIGISAALMQALNSFDPADASYMMGTKKIRPMAINIELNYSYELWTASLGWQKQKGIVARDADDNYSLNEAVLLPSTIYLAQIAVAIDENAKLSLEHRLALDEKAADGGASDEGQAAKTTLAYNLAF